MPRIRGEALAEIFQQHLPAAEARLGIADHALQHFAIVLALRLVFVRKAGEVARSRFARGEAITQVARLRDESGILQ